jgi:hemerythrin
MEAGMALFTWNSSYSVGVATIDQQHQQLMTLINELNEAMLQGKGRQMVGDILGKLIRYTGTHFADEEKLLMDHDYPEYAEHKAKHTKMVGKVKALQQDAHGISFFFVLWPCRGSGTEKIEGGTGLEPADLFPV